MQIRKNKHESLSVKCEFTNLHPQLLYSEKKLEHFFYNLFPIHVSGPTGVLSVVFMEQESHNQLHGQFLNDFRPTDVITFPADEEENQAGEICVSVDMAKEQSSLRKISLAEELSLYLIHGWLHLIGFNDIEKIDRVRMKQEEKNCLAIIKKSRLIPDFELASTSSFK